MNHFFSHHRKSGTPDNAGVVHKMPRRWEGYLSIFFKKIISNNKSITFLQFSEGWLTVISGFSIILHFQGARGQVVG
jgi:hypothetical protein